MIRTIHDVLSDAKSRIAPVSTSSALDAQLLLAEVLQVSRAHVIAHREQVLSPEQAAAYETFVQRREKGEPIAYLLGRRAFYDREFIVTPTVLIPRPETEHLVEAAIAFGLQHPGSRIVDIGTGSGAIAVTVAANVPDSAVYAVDISAAALLVAQQNAELNKVHVRFYKGNLLQPLIDADIQVNMLLANLPYIEHDEMLTLQVSQYEPHLALDGGDDGLDLFRQLFQQAAHVLLPGGIILLEIGASQGDAVRSLLLAQFPEAHVEVRQDYAGYDRLVYASLTR